MLPIACRPTLDVLPAIWKFKMAAFKQEVVITLVVYYIKAQFLKLHSFICGRLVPRHTIWSMSYVACAAFPWFPLWYFCFGGRHIEFVIREIHSPILENVGSNVFQLPVLKIMLVSDVIGHNNIYVKDIRSWIKFQSHIHVSGCHIGYPGKDKTEICSPFCRQFI